MIKSRCKVLSACCPSPNRLQAFGGSGGWITLYDAGYLGSSSPQGGCSAAYQLASSGITALQFRPGSPQQLAYGSEDGALALWDAGACLELQRLTQVHRSAISCCCYSSDGWLLAAGDASGLVSVWDLRHVKLLQLFRWEQHRALGSSLKALAWLVGARGAFAQLPRRHACHAGLVWLQAAPGASCVPGLQHRREHSRVGRPGRLPGGDACGRQHDAAVCARDGGPG